ncbi:hypothetical protein SAMN05421734_1161, partial [Pelagirhabdus alkalitolerans]
FILQGNSLVFYIQTKNDVSEFFISPTSLIVQPVL